MEWVQFAAKRDGIAARVHLHVCRGSTGRSAMGKAAVCCYCLPRDSKAVKWWPSLSTWHNGTRGTCGFGTKPVLDIGPGDGCERQIGRHKVDGEVRSLVYTLHVYVSTVDIVLVMCSIPGPGCWDGTMDR